jgi:hypothetical protein
MIKIYIIDVRLHTSRQNNSRDSFLNTVTKSWAAKFIK